MTPETGEAQQKDFIEGITMWYTSKVMPGQAIRDPNLKVSGLIPGQRWIETESQTVA